MLNIKIILILINKKKISNKFLNRVSRKFIKVIEQNISDKMRVTNKTQIDYLFHLSSHASAKHFIKKPIETSLPNIDGTNNLLKFSSTIVIIFFWL